MAKSRMLHDWDQTSIVWSAIANTARNPKKKSKPFLPSDIHPLRTEDDFKPKPVKADITVLKQLLKNQHG